MLSPDRGADRRPYGKAESELREESHAGFVIVRRPAAGRELPVIVAIPHFGTETLPGVEAGDYAAPEFVHFARGFADPFAAMLYGGLHASGATVIASRYSRLFIDLNRARDDYEHADGTVESDRGVVRTHTRSGRPVFRRRLTARDTESRLRRYYDPYHQRLDALLREKRRRGRRLTLLDAHSALSRRFGSREVIISTQRGRTARPDLAERIGQPFRDAGFRVDYDVPGYAGGHTVRRYGRLRNADVDAVQIEVGVSVLSETPREAFIETVKSGEHPSADADTVAALQACLSKAIASIAGTGGG